MATDRPGAGVWASRQIRSTLLLAAWTAAWIGSLALARFGPGSLWNDQPAATLVAIVFSALVGVGMLFAHRRFLRALDELQRTTQLQVMALTLGAGLVGGVAWTLFARHDLVAFEAEIAHLVAFMGVVYVLGSVAGSLRHR